MHIFLEFSVNYKHTDEHFDTFNYFFQTLKMLVKLCGKKEALLIVSPQFQKVHHYRHVMTHFIQTLQNYVVGEVIHTCRVFFERQLESVTDLDQLYTLHTTYIKNILFM